MCLNQDIIQIHERGATKKPWCKGYKFWCDANHQWVKLKY